MDLVFVRLAVFRKKTLTTTKPDPSPRASNSGGGVEGGGGGGEGAVNCNEICFLKSQACSGK